MDGSNGNSGQVPELVGLNAKERRSVHRAAHLFDLLEKLSEESYALKDLAREVQRAQRAAEETARMYKASAVEIQKEIRETRRRINDCVYMARQMLVDDIERVKDAPIQEV